MFKRGRAEGRDFFLGCIAQHKRDFLEGGNIEVFVIGRARLDMADCADKSFAERLHTMISNVKVSGLRGFLRRSARLLGWASSYFCSQTSLKGSRCPRERDVVQSNTNLTRSPDLDASTSAKSRLFVPFTDTVYLLGNVDCGFNL